MLHLRLFKKIEVLIRFMGKLSESASRPHALPKIHRYTPAAPAFSFPSVATFRPCQLPVEYQCNRQGKKPISNFIATKMNRSYSQITTQFVNCVVCFL